MFQYGIMVLYLLLPHIKLIIHASIRDTDSLLVNSDIAITMILCHFRVLT